MTKEQYLSLYQDKNNYHALWFDLLNASGFAGCLPNGNIVDRRYFPEAIPVQKNSMFGVSEPKEIEENKSKTLVCDPEILDVIINLVSDFNNLLGENPDFEYQQAGYLNQAKELIKRLTT